MKHTLEEIEELEQDFYVSFLKRAKDYEAGGKTQGTEVRQIIAAAGVIAKMVQTRGAMKALNFQIERETRRPARPALEDNAARKK